MEMRRQARAAEAEASAAAPASRLGRARRPLLLRRGCTCGGSFLELLLLLCLLVFRKRFPPRRRAPSLPMGIIDVEEESVRWACH